MSLREGWLGCCLLLGLAVGCGDSAHPAAPESGGSLALVHATLVDGTGAAPLPDATVLVAGERILAAGPSSAIAIPAGARVIELSGSCILPGFINAHVHFAFDAASLRTWARAGVTTVRDLEIISSSPSLAEAGRLLALRRTALSAPECARLLAIGYLITVPGGYGRTCVSSPEEARRRVDELLDQGADQIKYSLETGYAGVQGLPLLTAEEIAAIVDAAHARGRRVTTHITQAGFLSRVVESGADEAAHLPYDHIPDELIGRMVDRGFIIVPTLTVLEFYGALAGTADNLRRFVAAGGQVALGNDHTSTPPPEAGAVWELGMPMHELRLMRQAGMTPAQIVVAATRNAARACGLEAELGTVEAGKLADLLVVEGDPLRDLEALRRVRLVVHGGRVIRGAETF